MYKTRVKMSANDRRKTAFNSILLFSSTICEKCQKNTVGISTDIAKLLIGNSTFDTALGFKFLSCDGESPFVILFPPPPPKSHLNTQNVTCFILSVSVSLHFAFHSINRITDSNIFWHWLSPKSILIPPLNWQIECEVNAIPWLNWIYEQNNANPMSKNTNEIECRNFMNNQIVHVEIFRTQ